MPEQAHLRCPFEDCGSSDAFTFNEDKGVGFCHSCKKGYPARKKFKLFDWATEEYPIKTRIRVEDREVASVTYEGIRDIDPDVCKLYKIQLHLDAEGNPVRYAFGHEENVKYRGYEEKKFWTKERGKSINKLFGPPFNAGTSKKLYITEGEFDAASLYQVLGKTFPVVSLPTSSINEKFLKTNHDYLSSFEELVYAGELDPAGRDAADKLYQAYPSKMWFVPMTKWKDANEFVMNGDSQELMWAARKPQRYAPENFFVGDDAVEKAIREDRPYETMSCGHEGLDKVTRGLVKGGITFVKAPAGSGKTSLFRYMQYGLLTQNKDCKVALVHMEEVVGSTARGFATYELGANVMTEQDQIENGYTTDQVVEAALKVKGEDRFIIFEMNPSDEPLDIVRHCRTAAAIYGAQYIFIDHVQQLVYRSGIDGATGTLSQLATQLAELAKELGIGIICISHVNESGMTQYARALENVAIILIDIERDKESDDEIEKNTTYLYVSKNRPFAKLGQAGKLYYDDASTILTESFS